MQKQICRICTYPIFGIKKIVKYEKKAKHVYLTPCLPTAGRPGVEVKIMQNISKYVEYAEYGSAL